MRFDFTRNAKVDFSPGEDLIKVFIDGKEAGKIVKDAENLYRLDISLRLNLHLTIR